MRGWVRADRLQYSSSHFVGDRFALLGHAAGFIDPLYSNGLYVIHMSFMLLADLLFKASQTGDYSAAAFVRLEEMTLNYINMHDRLTASSVKSWSHPKLWRVYSIQWLRGAYLEYLMLSNARLRAHDRAEYIELLRTTVWQAVGLVNSSRSRKKIDELFEQVNPDDEADVDRVVAEAHAFFASFPWLPKPFQAVLDSKNHLPKNTIRLNLLNNEDGFMGSGAYRQHFFGDMTLIDLLRQGGKDQIRYSRFALKWLRRNYKWLAWKTEKP